MIYQPVVLYDDSCLAFLMHELDTFWPHYLHHKWLYRTSHHHMGDMAEMEWEIIIYDCYRFALGNFGSETITTNFFHQDISFFFIHL